jgi:5'-nucleotidase/UDP-sugar diphosphatase
MNSGGVRNSIEAGDISYRDILKVLPWGNSIVTVDLSGEELTNYLNDIFNKTPGSGGYVQRSTNLDINDGNIMLNGKNIQANKTYKLALPSYASKGGDDYPKLNLHPTYVDTGYVDADALKEYLSQR